MRSQHLVLGCARLRLSLAFGLICLGTSQVVMAGPIFVNLSQQGSSSLDYTVGGGPKVSADGSTVVGTSLTSGVITSQEARVFRWRENSGIQTIAPLTGGFFGTYRINEAAGVSADGSVIVGSARNVGGPSAAFRWSDAGGLQQLNGGLTNGLNGFAGQGANAVSADGSKVAGYVSYESGFLISAPRYAQQAVTWDAAGQMHVIGPAFTGASTTANALSANGSVVAGSYNAASFPLSIPGAVYDWYGPAANPNVMLNGAPPQFYATNAGGGLTADGKMMYGTADLFSTRRAAVFTNEGGLVRLQPNAGGFTPDSSSAYSASADGKLIGGQAVGGLGLPGFASAFMWDDTYGFRELNNLLVTQYGLGSAGIRANPFGTGDYWLQTVTGMSADGMVLAGIGGSYNGTGTGGSFAWAIDLHNVLHNTGFDQLGLNGWTVTGPGHAARILDPSDSTNYVAQLLTGSPVSISQSLATPFSPFWLDYDYWFRTTTGGLSVYLNSMLIDSLFAPGTLSGGFLHRRLLINDPSLWGLANTNLEFRFDGPTGSELLLDNIDVTAAPSNTAPEPSSLALLCVGGLSLIGWQSRQPKKKHL